MRNIIKKFKETYKKMFDKQVKNAYIWYSGATDITGIKLAELVGVDHGKTLPDLSHYDLIIGWGTKITKPLGVKKIRAMNHPNQIFINRDKFEALKLMQRKGVSVAGFVEAAKAVMNVKNDKSNLKLPVIGRTRYHQGGKGFWICPTVTHIKSAMEEGAGYFQNMIEIKEEYRLHIFNDKLLYAVKKVKRSKKEYQDAYVRHEVETQKQLAEKNDNPFDEATARLILERMAKKKVANGADMIIRSNKLGWKFSHININDKSPLTTLVTEAVKSLKALGLEFGAVDCCLDADRTPYIIEVNTGPGLEETPLRAYVEAFKDVIQNKTIKATPIFSSTKKEMLAKTALITEMIESADESETAALKGVFNKMFE